VPKAKMLKDLDFLFHYIFTHKFLWYGVTACVGYGHNSLDFSQTHKVHQNC